MDATKFLCSTTTLANMTDESGTPANWYADPQDRSKLRYWDGSRWTEHTAPAPRSGPAEPMASGAVPASGGGLPEPPERSRTGMFGAKKALESELQQLRGVVDGFGYAERDALNTQIAQLRSERDRLNAEVSDRRSQVAVLDAQLVKTREEVILQEVGVYDYHHLLEDSVAYKDRLDAIRQAVKQMSAKDGGAVRATTDWSVNGSVAQGRKMVNEFSKLLLRAYNGEADVLVNRLRPYKCDAAIDRLDKSRQTVARLGRTMSIDIADAFHQLRIEELRLAADFLAKKDDEKEAERAERERLREEAVARREFEAEKARLLKEQAHYAAALERMRLSGTPDEVAAAEQQLADIGAAIHGVEEREANIRAGYVYVISNFGTFGPGVVKIGMTRRLEPLDRVRELGDASVPFRYDVHALVFSDDAVSLEARLHQAFADRRVNLVNLRREFFYVTPKEVESVLVDADGSLLEFVEEPEADEWHQSMNARQASGTHAPIGLGVKQEASPSGDRREQLS